MWVNRLSSVWRVLAAVALAGADRRADDERHLDLARRDM